MNALLSNEPFDLVAFAPHPDDAELFCGGLLAKMSARKHRIAIVDLTRGERASRGTPEQRAREAEAAARVLGVAHRENLSLADAALINDAPSVALVVDALRRLRPQMVLAPFQRERHPDHEAASALVTRGVFLAGMSRFGEDEGQAPQLAPHAVATVLYYPMRHLAEPSFIVDVTDTMDAKRSAIACHASQVVPTSDGPQTLVSSPLAASALEARDAFYGAQIGAAFGEPYVVHAALGLVDPIEHFRNNHFRNDAFARPLFFPSKAQ